NNRRERDMSLIFKLLRKLYGNIIYYRYSKRIKDLIRRGLTVGKNVTIEHTVMIDTNYPYLIKIGNNCSLAQGVKLLAHDATPFKFLNGHTRLGKIEIKDNVFIGTDVIILPGVTIGPNVLIAAGSVINKDIPPNSCVAGVPARFYKKFDEFLNEIHKEIDERPVFELNELRRKIKDEKQLNKVRNAVDDGIAFIKGFEGVYRYTLNQE
ncbi:MAG: acyltransferase, partial [Candidatus Hodarchaeota archaeon]